MDVETQGAITTGETVADWRGHWHRPPNCDVAVEADTDEFMTRFIERVGALAMRTAAGRRLTTRGPELAPSARVGC